MPAVVSGRTEACAPVTAKANDPAGMAPPQDRAAVDNDGEVCGRHARRPGGRLQCCPPRPRIAVEDELLAGRSVLSRCASKGSPWAALSSATCQLEAVTRPTTTIGGPKVPREQLPQRLTVAMLG